MRLNFTVEYWEGKSDKAENALSKIPRHEEVSFDGILVISMRDLSTIHTEVNYDARLKKVMEAILEDPKASGNYSLQQGKLLFKD